MHEPGRPFPRQFPIAAMALADDDATLRALKGMGMVRMEGSKS